MRLLSALLIGLIFGIGIATSGMINPAKVLNFFDLFGAFDPSLALVMVSALLVTAIGYRYVLRRPSPVLAQGFSLPTARDIDAPLVGGSALFGIGWGIAGLCPGPGFAALAIVPGQAAIFVAAMLAGMLIVRLAEGRG